MFKGIYLLKEFFSFFLICFSYLPFVFSNVSYLSPVDKDLTLNKIAILPASDNAGGIYAQPLEAKLKQIVEESHHWDLIEEKIVGPIFTPQELENNEARVKNIIKTIKADAFIAAGVKKNPYSMTITLSLFLKQDSRLFLQEKEKKFKFFEIRQLNQQVAQMFQRLMNQLPYKGKILSRRGKSVTLGLGTKDGVKMNQELPVIQLIKMKRHPKFHFLVHSDKQTIGQVRVLKVEKTLSFGFIVMEVERNVIQKGSKISYIQPVHYTH